MPRAAQAVRRLVHGRSQPEHRVEKQNACHGHHPRAVAGRAAGRTAAQVTGAAARTGNPLALVSVDATGKAVR
ncbi:hypothetical protein GCM10009727_55000 [Actinomadura napierensis]|uniref:Uncharacterized protein n=1 Tax=Actinomadura napierensis TaxID=267854 RepID=A0ABN3A0G3_9ACTN